MAMMLPDGAGDDELMVELNTTPLIDVLLVLLVMLILSIPPQWHAVNMGLPAPSAKPPEIKPQVIVLEILPGNGLRWNGQALAGNDDLQTQMAEAARQSTPQVLHIRAHRQVPYSAVAHALSTAQRQGLQQVALLDGFD
ncbi:MAG: biopolymer transporter ExbD [Betaproteobacteria bacterium]